jgi:hypothetical protein
MLSATVCDKPENFALCGYVLGLYSKKREAANWINKANEHSTSLANLNGLSSNPMTGVHARIFPEHACRIRISDLGDAFPANQVLAQCYDMSTAKEIEEQYRLIEEEVARLKKKEESSGCVLAQILYARMRIEQLKIPTFLELAKKYREEGNALAIFVNFTMTLKTLADELGTRCLIYGEQSLEERNKAIRDFGEDRERVIICNIKSGGVGISLHDTNGNYPRVTIISPSWSAQDVLQTLGRTHRANGKSKVRQRIVFCKGTVEEQICTAMKEKILNIAALNDGEMKSYRITGLTDDVECGLDTLPEPTEQDILNQKISTLTTRKIRLADDIINIENELKILRYELSQVMRHKYRANLGSTEPTHDDNSHSKSYEDSFDENKDKSLVTNGYKSHSNSHSSSNSNSNGNSHSGSNGNSNGKPYNKSHKPYKKYSNSIHGTIADLSSSYSNGGHHNSGHHHNTNNTNTNANTNTNNNSSGYTSSYTSGTSKSKHHQWVPIGKSLL